jgi:hypothetical protein
VTGLAMVYTGSGPHHAVLEDPRYGRHISRLIYLPDLPDATLDDVDGLLVPCRAHHARVVAAAPKIRSLLERGGTVVAMAEQPTPWLPGLAWEHRPINFWWWREGGTCGLVAAQPEASLFDYVTLADASWHFHGVFHPPAGAETILAAEDGAAVLYVDRVSTPGTIVATTLDPMYHVGSNFMPAAARFLEGFLPWLVERMLPCSPRAREAARRSGAP